MSLIRPVNYLLVDRPHLFNLNSKLRASPRELCISTNTEPNPKKELQHTLHPPLYSLIELQYFFHFWRLTVHSSSDIILFFFLWEFVRWEFFSFSSILFPSFWCALPLSRGWDFFLSTPFFSPLFFFVLLNNLQKNSKENNYMGTSNFCNFSKNQTHFFSPSLLPLSRGWDFLVA